MVLLGIKINIRLHVIPSVTVPPLARSLFHNKQCVEAETRSNIVSHGLSTIVYGYSGYRKDVTMSCGCMDKV